MTSSRGRVLFVDHTAVLGGAELSLLDIAVAFRDRGAVALFEDGPFAAALVTEGVALVPFTASESLKRVKKGSRLPGLSALAASASAAVGLARIARPFDLLYANSLKSFLVSVAASTIARRPVVWHLRDILDRGHFSRANVRVLVAAANLRAARVVTNSRATAEAFVAAGGRRALVRVVHNGIDASRFDRLTADASRAMRDSLGIPREAFVVGSFSRLHPWKGQRVLLDAITELPGVHAIIAGGALFSGETEYEAELARISAQPPLAGRVHMVGARSDVPDLMAACDVVAHTSVLPEPFGRVIVEALLSRRPVIASDAGGVREIVEHGVTALLTIPGDVPELAAAIRSLRDDPSLALSLANAGRAAMMRRFTREAMIAGVGAVIDDVLSGVQP